MSKDAQSIETSKPKPVVWIIAGIVIVGGMAGGALFFKKEEKPKKKAPAEIVSIVIPPLPPPPPPPPPPPKQERPPEEKVEEKMVEQEPVVENEPPPSEEAPSDPGPPDLGIAGDGPGNGYGPSGSGKGGNGNGTGGRKGGSKFGWYAGQVQSAISDALRKNARTKNSRMSIKVKVWADSTGRITRAKLIESTGDSSLDTAIKTDVLTGLQLPGAPPQDMPMPINLRLSARKPN